MGKLVAIFALVIAGCAPQRKTDAPAPPIDKTRLSHGQHAQIACTSCHTMGNRPGHDHKPCDDCHKEAFLAKPGALCEVCHTKITTVPLVAELKPYPVEDLWRTEPSRFSHQVHLDAQRIESRVGFHVSCADCHVNDQGKLARPDHATCARCHATEAGLAGAPKMDACASCHETTPQVRTRARLIKNDLKFDHEHHRTDRRGTPIKCDQCHRDTPTATGYVDHVAPRIETCVGCHDDSDRTPPTMRMRVCETCHSAREQRLTSIAPRNHLPATERPIDHTLAFRRDHADAAERDAARCAACHTQMSGNPRDACDECHQTMAPQDHRITWRELDHGTEAAADRDRCARCHVIEFCTACHAQRPRSHGFPGTFSTNHGGLARLNVRSCLTCHDEQHECGAAGCHGIGTPRRTP